MKKVEIELYNYNELSKEAKENAMNDHVELILEMISIWRDEFEEDIKEAERNQTPWFLGQIIYQNNKDKLTKELQSLGECFHSDGTRFNKRN